MYFGFSSTSAVSRVRSFRPLSGRGDALALRFGLCLRHLRPCLDALADGEVHDRTCGRGLTGRPRHEVEEVPLDPVAREVVGNLDDELLTVVRARMGLTEPRVVGRLGEGVPKAAGDRVPEVVRSCLSGVFHPSSRFVGSSGRWRA